MRVKILVVSFLCLILGHGSSEAAATGKEQSVEHYQIVFTEFDKSSGGDYSYLRNSIQAMLASRLAARDQVNVLEKTFTEKELIALKKQGMEKALTVGGKRADYLVTGALFSLTSGLETQVELYPLVSDKDILHFSILSKTPDTLISDIEQLSDNIAQKAFGEPVDQPGATDTIAGAAGDAAFVTVHPEAAYKKHIHSGTIVGVKGSGVTTKGRGARLNTIVPTEMRAMAVGDVDGNGQKEIIIVSGRKLMLFGTSAKSIDFIAETKLPASLDSHAVNTADLDGDGKEEIYLSATSGVDVSSMIMSYSNNTFKVVAEHIRWYLRPLFAPGVGWQLHGQRRGTEKNELVRPGIFQITLDGNRVVKGKRLALPGSLNLFDFVYADIDGDTFAEIVAVDQKGKLRVYNPGNELMWVSKKNFGSSKIYIGPSRGGIAFGNERHNFTPDEDVDRDLIFVPGTILVTDINKDGKQELLVSEGKRVGLTVFNKLRSYDGGAVVSMVWNGDQLIESWRTGNFRGYVGGYGFSLVDDVQATEIVSDISKANSFGRLFVGNLPASGSLSELLPGSGKTELSAYDLEFVNEIVE